MLDKSLTLTQLNRNSLEALAELCKDPWFGRKADFKEAYIRRYVMPKFFLPRNKEIAILLVSDKKLFNDLAKRDLLKECDLSDYIKASYKNNMIYRDRALFRFVSGYKIDDDAAWILMENCSHEEPVAYTALNIHSVWFREFQNEDTGSLEFKRRLERAVRWKNAYIEKKDNRGGIANSYIVNLEFDTGQRILNFHLGVNYFSPNNDIFSGYINQSFTDDYPSLPVNLLLWMVGHLTVKDLYSYVVICPVLLYHPDVSEFLNKHVDEAREYIQDLYGDNVKNRIWNELLGTDLFNQLKKDYPDLIDDPFVNNQKMWSSSQEIIDNILPVWKTEREHTSNESHEKIFKKVVIRYLEKKFDTKIDSPSLSQLLSIYETSKEGAPVV